MARQKAAWCSRSRRNSDCRCASSALARKPTICGRLRHSLSSTPCLPLPTHLERMIQFDDVSKRYPSGQEALSHIDFQLARGELAFLTGHSGAGKSTLLKLIMLMELPSSGQVIVNGQNLGKVSRKQLP